jgi:hypothetical protein
MNSNTGKILIAAGLLLTLAGVVILFLPKKFMPGQLPGDIHFRGKNMEFYFPIVSCILLSLLLSLAMYLFRHFRR